MIDFDCPKCGDPLSVPDELVRKREKCPSCGRLVRVPPQGIGGWLVIPALGLICGPIVLVVHLWNLASRISCELRIEPPASGSQFPAGYLGLDLFYPGFNRLLVGSLALTLGQFCFVICAALVFFRIKVYAPKVMLCLLATNVTLNIVDYVWTASVFDDWQMDMDYSSDFISSVGAAIIWALYFLCSRRVEVTFVNP